MIGHCASVTQFTESHQCGVVWPLWHFTKMDNCWKVLANKNESEKNTKLDNVEVKFKSNVNEVLKIKLGMGSSTVGPF